jgi:hypothetical protein
MSKKFTPRPPRTRNRFRQRELARALRAAKAAGGELVEIDPQSGKITITIGKSDASGSNPRVEMPAFARRETAR